MTQVTVEYSLMNNSTNGNLIGSNDVKPVLMSWSGGKDSCLTLYEIQKSSKFDKSGGRALSAGTFAFMPPGMRHFAWTTGETVIQLHGTGPWKINYVNPADDPRKPKQ